MCGMKNNGILYFDYNLLYHNLSLSVLILQLFIMYMKMTTKIGTNVIIVLQVSKKDSFMIFLFLGFETYLLIT